MPATITKVFIPRVLGNVTISQIRCVFAAKNLGKVTNIDVHHRKNEKNHRYSFVFLDLALYNSQEASDLCKDMLANGSTKLYYDNKNYWEVKTFLSKAQRLSMIEMAENQEKTKKTEEEEEDKTATETEEEISSICTDLLVPSYSYDIAWLRMSVHSELLHTHHTREMNRQVCFDCKGQRNPLCDATIFWKNYSFCSKWCQYNTEYDIRKSWRMSKKNRDQILRTIMPDILQQQSQLTTESRFMAYVKRIQNEEDAEMQVISNLCEELARRPSGLSAEDKTQMVKEYEALEKEIFA